MTKKTKIDQQKPEIKNSKKPYARPRLVEYGDVAKLTSSGGSRGFPDGIMTLMP